MKYKILKQQIFSSHKYSIVPIRYEDRFDIMKWRNQQIYHLRQAKPLTKEDQDAYFDNVVLKLFEQEKPEQILFSYLENDKCIGYGGLVHINWRDKNAEISFVMNTELEKEFFKIHWGIFLQLLEQIAFHELNFHKIFTYAFDLRPHLYEAVESKSYLKEAVLKEHYFFDGKFKNIIIHSKYNPQKITYRKMKEEDRLLMLEWANEKTARENSFSTELITIEDHTSWFHEKYRNKNAHYFICEVNNNAIGIVRFDIQDDFTVVGINLSKEFRSKGLSSIFLKDCLTFYFDYSYKPLRAFIKEENISSIKAFEKVGFKLLQKTVIKNKKSFIYELKTNDL
ncbi:MAG: GNAT family N-acetyltransferase [Chitinophagaceae bacterium]|nr:GNAT family N-acetyltransferase [Chitinophagaceae bacterium]